MCDLGGDLSSELGTWQCASCGKSIEDEDVKSGNFPNEMEQY